MKITIDLTSASYHLTGIERYALCISEEILKQDCENEYHLIFRNSIHDQLKPYVDGERVRATTIYGDHKLWFMQITLLRALKKSNADRYLFFAFPAPILFKEKEQYSTLHDMGRWDYDDDRLLHKLYFRTSESSAIKHAKKVFTVSEFSKERIYELFSYPRDRIIVTYNGISNSVTASIKPVQYVKEKYKLPSRYIMYLSTLQPRKGLKLLLEAYAAVMDHVTYDLVLAGRNGWQTDDLIEKYDAEGRIVFTGFVEDEDLGTMYRHALCFVFPSLYEGFGIPPVESLACGTPVLSSDSSCMPEILREQAMYFRNNDVEDLKEKLLVLEKTDSEMRGELDSFQLHNYKYSVSAEKILKAIGITS